MIFHTPIMAIILVSILSSLTMIWAALFALKVVRGWNIESGHARQIELEKRTYLVTTAVKFVLVIEFAALILFVLNADRMAVMFTGAMCAVGTLNVNGYGMPALILKLLVFFGAAVWLIVNHADEKGHDYPFTRYKYSLLAALGPLVIGSGLIQFLYFFNLQADVITSCCSRLFVPETEGIDAVLSSADPKLALYGLYTGLAALVGLAAYVRKFDKWRVPYALASSAFFALGIIAIVSVVSSYIYEQPHHHCPFCILKPEYGYIGFALYLPLFMGTALGLASGALAVHPLPDSLKTELPVLIRRHVTWSGGLFVLFGLICLYAIARSHLILFN